MKSGTTGTVHLMLGPMLASTAVSEIPLPAGDSVASNFSVYVDAKHGDDEHGDGSRDKPFRTRERAAAALGVPVGLLTGGPPPDPEPPIGPLNRRQRRAARKR